MSVAVCEIHSVFVHLLRFSSVIVHSCIVHFCNFSPQYFVSCLLGSWVPWVHNTSVQVKFLPAGAPRGPVARIYDAPLIGVIAYSVSSNESTGRFAMHIVLINLLRLFNCCNINVTRSSARGGSTVYVTVKLYNGFVASFLLSPSLWTSERSSVEMLQLAQWRCFSLALDCTWCLIHSLRGAASKYWLAGTSRSCPVEKPMQIYHGTRNRR